MKESSFRLSVLNKLPGFVHRQPMLAGMMGTAGTPDTYFDHERDLWVEWKFIGEYPSVEKLPKVVPAKAMPTEIQKEWLDRRWNAGGNACVITGVKIRGRAQGFVLHSPAEWSVAPLRDHYAARLRSPADLAQYILERVSCPTSSATVTTVHPS